MPVRAAETPVILHAADGIERMTLSLTRGQRKQLQVNVPGKVTWRSTDKTVASVSKTGLVKALKKGVTVIKGKVNGKLVLRCVLTVSLTRWDRLQDQYADNPAVNQLLFVRYQGGSKAKIQLYTKKKGSWKRVNTWAGYVGKNGIDKVKQGDKKTPTGDFELTSGYGIKKNPGAAMDYIQVNKYMYWCADRKWYNQLIDIREHPHTCHGEHLINYQPQYYYGMFMDYNPENIPGKGCAIFLHCTGKNPYTMGCVAVPEKAMIRILKYCAEGARICIFPEK